MKRHISILEDIPNFLIDRRLKPGKDYPEDELTLLTDLFKRGIDGEGYCFRVMAGRGLKRRLQQDIDLIKNTFCDFFLSDESQKINEAIERVNRKLLNVSPMIVRRVTGYRLEPFNLTSSIVGRRIKTQPSLIGLSGWLTLATVMGNLKRDFVHQCPRCEKIFFSKKIRVYHRECRSKFLYEKYQDEGRFRKAEKEYRERKKKNRRDVRLP